MANDITQTELKSLIHYDQNTGIFTNLTNRSPNCRIGGVSGCVQIDNGGKKYRYIEIEGKRYQAHRLAWFYMKGTFPPDGMDHEDGNGLNNIFSNLRSVDAAENSKNKRIQSNNTSGISGVHWYKPADKWVAQIRVNRKCVHLGYFVTLFAAAYARHLAEIKYNFHPNHGTARPL